MPSQESSHRFQYAVLWPKTGHSQDGEAVVGEPEEITVRWNNKLRVSKDAQGNPVAVDAVVHVNQEIAVGSSMWLGELEDWYGTGSGGDDSAVMEVLTYNDTKDLKARNTRMTVGLVFYRDTLPGA